MRLIYQISIHTSDIKILQKLKEYFNNKGEITEAAGYVHFRVTNIKDIQEVIIPHFSSYPLQSTKVVSYTIFKQVATIIKNKEHLTLDGFKKVLSLKAALPKGLDAAVFKDSQFSDIVPFDTSNVFVKNTFKLSPYYVAGFVAADGSFYIISPNYDTKWPNYNAGFSIAQNKRDEFLLLRIIEILECGIIQKDCNNMRYIYVRNKKELYDIILPFFQTYFLNNGKDIDFYYFSIALGILYKNLGKGLKNLTSEDINQLDLCKKSMNKNRYSKSSEQLYNVMLFCLIFSILYLFWCKSIYQRGIVRFYSHSSFSLLLTNHIKIFFDVSQVFVVLSCSYIKDALELH